MARPVSGKSLQTMKPMLIRDLALDNGVVDVFKKLIDEDTDGDVEGLELDKKTSKGDTMLHRLVHASVDSPLNMKYYLQIVDRIHSRSAQWYRKYKCSSDDKAGEKDNHYDCLNDKYYAMIELCAKSIDTRSTNVWELATEEVSIEMIEKLMYLHIIPCGNDSMFDVSMFVNMNFTIGNVVSRLCSCFCHMNGFDEELPSLLQQTIRKNKFEELMRVKPMKKLTDIFCSISTKIYIVVVFLHIVYMSLFSYLGCELMDARNPKPTDTTKGLMYSFGLVEPILLSFYLFNTLFKLPFWKLISKDMDKRGYRKVNYFREMVWFITILVYDVLLCEVIASVGSEITPTRRNILSVCLLLGWLLTFALANGIKQIHFFFKLILRVIFTDVLKIFLVFIIFLLGFSLSIHAQFISSANITMTYETPIHTMYLLFNVMVGMQEAVDDDTETYLEAASASPLFSKVLYIGYVLCSTIVLLNLLIAMMNTSYSTTEIEHLNEWVFDAVHFGIKTSKYFPALAHILGAYKIKKVELSSNSKSVRTIELSQMDLQFDNNPIEAFKYTEKHFKEMKHEIEHTEKILKAEIADMKRSQYELMELIKDMQGGKERRTQTDSEPNEGHSTPSSNRGNRLWTFLSGRK